MVELWKRKHDFRDLDIIWAFARVYIESFGSCFCYGVKGVVVVMVLVVLL